MLTAATLGKVVFDKIGFASSINERPNVRQVFEAAVKVIANHSFSPDTPPVVWTCVRLARVEFEEAKWAARRVGNKQSAEMT
jgi:hypothetical protein